MVVKSVVNKSGNKVFVIQSIDRKMDFEDIARARDLDFDELLTEIEAIVNSGTKLNINYYIEQTIDEDKAEEIYLYFKEDAESDSVDEAIAHIAAHSTGHSEAIVTEDPAHADAFVNSVDSAAVYVNASTRFTDGGEFGLGCEMGISTQKLHARGPMGLDELTTYKYVIRGDGQIR